MAQIPLILVIAFIFTRATFKVIAGQVHTCLVSVLSAVLYLFALIIPAHLQAAGLLVSKLELGMMLPFPDARDISHLSLAWAAELAVILLGELASKVLWQPNVIFFPELRRLMSPVVGEVTGGELRRVANVLIVVGLIAAVAFPVQVEHRAEGGQGFDTILHTFLTVGLSLLAYNRFFSRRAYYVVGAIGIAILIAGKVRNPVLVVLVGYLAGVISRRELKVRKALIFLLASGVFSILAAWMSTMRGAIIRHERAAPLIALGQTLENPFVSIYAAGIDTLDGYRLSMEVLPFERPHPESIETIFTTFVPRAIWPDKPMDISNIISERYLSYGKSGMFLSPVGHLSLVFGGYGYALVGMFVFGFVSAWLIRVFLNSFVLAIILLVIFDYLLAGGFFCIYLGIVQLIPLVTSTMFIRVFRIRKFQQPVIRYQ
jgi:hypothetical protein